MNKKSIIHSLIFGNKAVEICIFFTISTMLDLLICVFQGITDISYLHLGYRFVLCVCVAVSFYLFKFFENMPIFLMLIIHCGISILIMVGSVWMTSLFSEIHPNAYRDAVRTILIVYPIIILGCIIVDGVRTAKANRILRARLGKTDSTS